VPAYPIAGSFAGCLDGLSIEEYCTNPKKAVKAMLNYYERYRRTSWWRSTTWPRKRKRSAAA
jgi:hypothetical protein